MSEQKQNKARNKNSESLSVETQTPAEIRETLGVTDTTIRNYVKRFGRFLSPDATRKTQKRFNENDIKVLRIAKGYLDQKYTYEQTINLLESQDFDDILDQPLPKPEPEINQTSALAIYRETIRAKDAHIADLQKEIRWLRLPWWRRIFSDPPE